MQTGPTHTHTHPRLSKEEMLVISSYWCMCVVALVFLSVTARFASTVVCSGLQLTDIIGLDAVVVETAACLSSVCV